MCRAYNESFLRFVFHYLSKVTRWTKGMLLSFENLTTEPSPHEGKNLGGDEQMENKTIKTIGFASYVISVICIFMGLYKMFVYENPDSDILDSVNAYVGGDAYNFIINANYATAYFVLAAFFMIFGSSLLIMAILKNNTEELLVAQQMAADNIVTKETSEELPSL